MVTVETILACALRSRRSFSTLRRAVTSDLAIANPFQLDLMRWVADHVDSYGDVPGDGDAELWIAEQPGPRQDTLRITWRSLRRQDLSGFSEDNLAETAARVLKDRAAHTAITRLAGLTKTGQVDPDVLDTLAREVRDIRPVSIDGLANLADMKLHMRPSSADEDRTETGIEKLDQILGGGFGAELVFLLAGTGVGKTTFLINRLTAAALRGSRCLHITLELVTDKTLHRYYRRIADAHRGEFFSDYDQVEHRVQHWLRLATGSVHVLYLPAFSASVDDVRATCEIFADTHGGLDVIALDYMDLLKRDEPRYRGLRTDEQLGIISHELRTICTSMDAEVITASQANREGLTADRLTLKHMAGAIAKAQAADVVMGLVQTAEEDQARQARLGLLKMRDYPGQREIPLHYDKDRMTIMDLDHPTARRRRRELEAVWASEDASNDNEEGIWVDDVTE